MLINLTVRNHQHDWFGHTGGEGQGPEGAWVVGAQWKGAMAANLNCRNVLCSRFSFVVFDDDGMKAIGADILGINRRLDVAVLAIGEAGNRCCHLMSGTACVAAPFMNMKTG